MHLRPVGHEAPRTPTAEGPHGSLVEPGPNGDVDVADWDTLFGAVSTTLRQCVGTGLRSVGPLRDMSLEVQGQVLQCVEALDQLRTTMLHHIDRAEETEVQLRMALVEADTELADAHANERTARHQAVHDGLPSLPNREGFKARLADVLVQAADRGETFALLYIDLDGFKAINDGYGHATGDHLLRIVASRLAAAVRAEDTVSRLGGDEFACLLWQAPPSRAVLARVATTLYDVVSAPFQIGTLTLTVRPSIGIALWPDDGLTADALLAHADAAMVRAKRTQTGHAWFDTGTAAAAP